MKSLIAILSVVTVIITMYSFKLQQDDPWKVPEKYKSMKNPVLQDSASIKSGKQLYVSYCISCHGKNGNEQEREPQIQLLHLLISLLHPSKIKQMAHCYIRYFGRREMPGFKKRIHGNSDVIEGTFGKTCNPGDLINYLRTFGKKLIVFN